VLCRDNMCRWCAERQAKRVGVLAGWRQGCGARAAEHGGSDQGGDFTEANKPPRSITHAACSVSRRPAGPALDQPLRVPWVRFNRLHPGGRLVLPVARATPTKSHRQCPIPSCHQRYEPNQEGNPSQLDSRLLCRAPNTPVGRPAASLQPHAVFLPLYKHWKSTKNPSREPQNTDRVYRYRIHLSCSVCIRF